MVLFKHVSKLPSRRPLPFFATSELISVSSGRTATQSDCDFVGDPSRDARAEWFRISAPDQMASGHSSRTSDNLPWPTQSCFLCWMTWMFPQRNATQQELGDWRMGLT